MIGDVIKRSIRSHQVKQQQAVIGAHYNAKYMIQIKKQFFNQ
jgi:hypothetical protein